MHPILFYSYPQYLRFGGDNLKHRVKIKEPMQDLPLAEVWEISDHKLHSSEIRNQPFQGKTLKNLIKSHGKQILGKYYSPGTEQLPLMIRLLDICESLPPAVHPSDEYAQTYDIGDAGKYEACHVISCSENAEFYSGIKPDLEIWDLQAYIDKGKSYETMNCRSVHTGDTFYVPAGMLHAWGAGSLVYEVHTVSNAIFALDWLDWDKDQERKNYDFYHLKNCLQHDPSSDYKISIEILAQRPTYFHQRLCATEYFIMEKIICSEDIKLSDDHDRFSLFTLIKGSGIIESEDSFEVRISSIETVLIPAASKNTVFKCDRECTFLKIFIE